MIENFIQGHNYNDKIIYPIEISCWKNYDIVCRNGRQEYPWDYAQELRITGLHGTYSINATSSSAISIPFFGSFS